MSQETAAAPIVPATEADVPALVALVNSAYRGDSARLGWTSEAHLLDGQRIDETALREMLHAPNAAILTCRTAAGELLGCFHAQATGPRVSLSMLAVAPTGQGRGVGKALLEAAEAYGREHSCTLSKMTVISVRPELIAYYERRGYRLTGATEPFPTDTRFGIPRQPLTLLVLEKPLAFG
jgi:ribosomal protein S18 acetylase RimI-like enzyme